MRTPADVGFTAPFSMRHCIEQAMENPTQEKLSYLIGKIYQMKVLTPMSEEMKDELTHLAAIMSRERFWLWRETEKLHDRQSHNPQASRPGSVRQLVFPRGIQEEEAEPV